MKKINSQKQWVKSRLVRRGFVTRNEALRNGIYRLSARIYQLKEEGMEIEGSRLELKNGGYDWKYTLVDPF